MQSQQTQDNRSAYNGTGGSDSHKNMNKHGHNNL